MAVCQFATAGAARAHYEASGWLRVPGQDRTLYRPDSYDPGLPGRLRVVEVDPCGSVALYSAWEGAAVWAFVEGCHTALVQAFRAEAQEVLGVLEDA